MVKQVKFEDGMGVQLAAVYCEMTENRLKELVRSEQVVATKVDGKWTFRIADLDAYLAKPKPEKAVVNGNRAHSYRVKITSDEQFTQVVEALKTYGVVLMPMGGKSKAAEAIETRLAKTVNGK